MARFSILSFPACVLIAPAPVPGTGADCPGLRPAVRARHRAAPGRRHARRHRHLQGGAGASCPDRADALSNLGAAYVRLGQFDDAIAQYEAALKVDPSNNAVRLNLALAYYKSARPQRRPSRSSSASSRPIPRRENAYLVLADCYLQTGQDKERRRAAEAARADVRRTISRTPICSARRCCTWTTPPKGRSTSIGCSAPASRPKRTC